MSDQKTVMISLRLTEREAEWIRELSLESGMTVSQWIRARITGIK